MADHTSWNDFSIKNKNPGIISRVQSQVRKKIAEDYRVDEKSTRDVRVSAFGRMFSRLLPPEDFGTHSKGGINSGKNGGQGGSVQKTTGATISFNSEDICYNEDGIVIPVNLKINGKSEKTVIEMFIDSENGEIAVENWENEIGLPLPFELYEYDIVSDENEVMTTVVSDKPNKISGINYSLVATNESNMGYKIMIESGSGKKTVIKLILRIRKYRNDMRPVIKLGKVD